MRCRKTLMFNYEHEQNLGIIVAIGYTSSFYLAAAVVLVFGVVVLVSGRFLGQPEATTEP